MLACFVCFLFCFALFCFVCFAGGEHSGNHSTVAASERNLSQRLGACELLLLKACNVASQNMSELLLALSSPVLSPWQTCAHAPHHVLASLACVMARAGRCAAVFKCGAREETRGITTTQRSIANKIPPRTAPAIAAALAEGMRHLLCAHTHIHTHFLSNCSRAV